jgi:hypothetical protein
VKLEVTTVEKCNREKSKTKIGKSKKVEKVVVVEELTDEEREAVYIVFHQFETGLREGTILVKVTTYLYGYLLGAKLFTSWMQT